MKLETKPDKLENRVLVSWKGHRNCELRDLIAKLNNFPPLLGIFTMPTIYSNSKGAYKGKFSPIDYVLYLMQTLNF